MTVAPRTESGSPSINPVFVVTGAHSSRTSPSWADPGRPPVATNSRGAAGVEASLTWAQDVNESGDHGLPGPVARRVRAWKQYVTRSVRPSTKARPRPLKTLPRRAE